MLRKSIYVIASLTIIVLTATVFDNNKALAQTPGNKTATGEPTPKPDRSKWESKDNGNLAAEAMKTKVDLPNLPEFTGHAKFTGGVVNQGEYGQSYVMRFTAKEDPKLVLDWYKNTLNMYKWKIEYADDQTVAGKLAGATCAVVVNDIISRKNGSQSEIEINYFQNKTR